MNSDVMNSRHRTEGFRSNREPAAVSRTDLDFVDTSTAASLLGLSQKTLERWRVHGGGPIYRKMGRRVVYGRADLVDFADAAARQHTAQKSGGAR